MIERDTDRMEEEKESSMEMVSPRRFVEEESTQPLTTQEVLEIVSAEYLHTMTMAPFFHSVSQEVAEDIIADAFADTIGRVSSDEKPVHFSNADAVKRYLHRAISLGGIDVSRRNTTAQQKKHLLETDVLRERTPNPEEEVVQKLWWKEVRELLGETYIVPLLLHHRYGFTLEEAAAQLGISRDAIHQRLVNARAMLSDVMRQEETEHPVIKGKAKRGRKKKEHTE